MNFMGQFMLNVGICRYAYMLSLISCSFLLTGQITVNSLPYTPPLTDFDDYNPSSSVNLGATIPSGWTAVSTGTPSYQGQGDGSSSTGGYWGYGTGMDFSAGALRSGTTGNITYSVSFVNNSGSTIHSITLGWDYEQWRFANTSGWNVSGTGALSGNVTLNGMDFTGQATGVNGTPVATVIGPFVLSGLNIAHGASFGISWVTTDDAGADNGVAIDNFNISACSEPLITGQVETVCSGESFSFLPAGTPAGITFSWNAPTGVGFTGGAAGVNETAITGTLVNTTILPVVALYTVTPQSGECTGLDFLLAVTIQPQSPAPVCPSDMMICNNSGAFELSGGMPEGGEYSGPAVSMGMFDPALAPLGTNVISYTTIDGNGCSATCTFNIDVLASPITDAGSYGPLCMLGPDITLNGSPLGGVWSGIGVTGNVFDPTAGTQTLTYTVTAENGCSHSDQVTIVVNSCLMAPEVRWILLEEGVENGLCESTSDCDDGIICFALQYTPNVTGTLTAYTSGFYVSCNGGPNPVVSNSSCYNNDSSIEVDVCATNNFTYITASNNNTNTSIQQGVPKILHQVCFTMPATGSITITEDEEPGLNITMSIDSITSNTPLTEAPFYATFSFGSMLECQILPLRFLSFDAVKHDDLVSRLSWTTADEINNQYFSIERSIDGGKSFQVIGEVKAIKPARNVNQYEFFDEHAFPGHNYYRLKQIDLDGLYQYSQVRSVVFSKSDFNVKIWPNPASDFIQVITNYLDEQVQINLVDITGKVVFNTEYEGRQLVKDIDVSRLLPGMYTVHVTSGAYSHMEKIVVQP